MNDPATLHSIAERIRDRYPEPIIGESWETALPKVALRGLADILDDEAGGVA